MSDLATRALPWFKKGTWTVLDQALFAGSNFLLNILLARWLPREEFGVFATAFAVFLLFGMFHTGMVSEPMLVFGPGKFKARVQEYLGLLVRGHFAFTAGGALLLGAAALVMFFLDLHSYARVFGTLAVCQVLILYLWQMRKSCYVFFRPEVAALSGVVYAIIMLAGAWALYYTGLLSAAAGIGLMCLAGTIAGLVIMSVLKIKPGVEVDPAFVAEAKTEHWKYGRWASGTGLVQWIPGQVWFVLLPLVAGEAASGIMKAMMNLIMPAMHAYAALTSLLVPAFVRANEKGRFGSFTSASIGLVVVAMIGYAAVLNIWGAEILSFVYDGKYDDSLPLLRIVSIIPIVTGVIAMLASGLKALELPDKVFWAYVVSTGTALTIGVVLMNVHGVSGALLGNLLAVASALPVLIWFYLKARKGMS